MEDTIEQLEAICELLVELAALQHLRNSWIPNRSTDRHEIERFMLLEKLISKKEQLRSQQIHALQEEYPELDPLLEALSRQYHC